MDHRSVMHGGKEDYNGTSRNEQERRENENMKIRGST